MRFVNSRVIVSDLQQAMTFYEDVLNQKVRSFNGDSVTFISGIQLFSEVAWKECLLANESELKYGGNNSVLYFEQTNFDSWVLKLEARSDIEFINHLEIQPNGQRIVRFYDYDHHVIEVGEAVDNMDDDDLIQQMNYVDAGCSLGGDALGTLTIHPDIDTLGRNQNNN